MEKLPRRADLQADCQSYNVTPALLERAFKRSEGFAPNTT